MKSNILDIQKEKVGDYTFDNILDGIPRRNGWMENSNREWGRISQMFKATQPSHHQETVTSKISNKGVFQKLTKN